MVDGRMGRYKPQLLLFALLTGAIVALSCGDDAATGRGFSEVCSGDSSCEESFTCLSGICTTDCSTDDDCQDLGRNPACNGGTCYETCNTASDCRNADLQCVKTAADSPGRCLPR